MDAKSLVRGFLGTLPPHLLSFAGEGLHSYREDLQHCPREGVVASAQTPQC